MGNEKVLLERRKAEHAKADAIVALAEQETRGITADEEKDIQAFMAEVARLDEEIESLHRAKAAKDLVDAKRAYDVPAAVAGASADPLPGEQRQAQRVEIHENEQRTYRKGDALAAIIGARIKHDAHQQHIAVRDAEKLYGSASPQFRALQQSVFTAGGALIPENFVGSEFIEALRAKSAFRQAGPRQVQLVNGSFTTPRLVGVTTGGYLPAEGDNLGTTEPTFGQLKLVEKKFGCIVPFSNDLKRNQSLDAMRVVTEDLVKTVAIDEDTQCFNGTGLSGTPMGIYYWIPSTQKSGQTGTSLANVRTDIRKMKNGLDSNHAPDERRAWFGHSRTMNYLGWDLVDGNSNFAFPSLQSSTGATLGGDPFYKSNVLSITGGGGTESQIFYVEMSECYLAESMDMELEVFNNAAYSQGGTIRSGISRDESVIRLIRKWDFGMRHTVSAYVLEAVTLGA